MAKLKVQGNASGTGVVTLTAPNTNTDRTITLPDGDISLGVGIDDNATSTAITIDSSENVKVGNGHTITSGYGETLHIKGTFSGAYSRPFLIESADSGNRILDIWEDSSGAELILQDGDGSDLFRVKPDGRGLSQFTAKAWVNFNGVGTVFIRDSHNVSSITDNGVGNHQVNFAVSMTNSSYSAIATPRYSAVNGETMNSHIQVDATSYVKISSTFVHATANASRDFDSHYVQVFGD